MSTAQILSPPPVPVDYEMAQTDTQTAPGSVVTETVNTLAHKIKWSFIRKKQWHKLRKTIKTKEKEKFDAEDGETLYEAELSYLSQIVPCRLTKTKFIIGRYDRDVFITLNLKHEVYCVKRDKDDPNTFMICSLVNEHIRTLFKLSAVVSDVPLEDQVNIWIGFINMSMFELPRPIHTLPSRKVLVVINPASGGMTGEAQFNNTCQPIFEDAVEAGHLTYKIFFTTKEEKGSDITKSIEDLSEWDVIAAGGGDGTLHDCLTGLLERNDWERAIKIPLCPLPMGTSNAMANSLYGSKHQLTRASMALVRGFMRPMDVCTVLQESGERYFSFLTVMYGFLANVTHKTDSLRKLHLGESRNQVGAVKELLQMDTYKAKLSYVQYEGPKLEIDLKDIYNENNQLPEHVKRITNPYHKMIETLGEQIVEGNKVVEESFDPNAPQFEKREFNGPPCPLLSHYFPEAFQQNKLGYVPQNGTYVPDPHNKEVIEMEDDFFAIQLMNVSHLGAKYSLAPSTYLNSEFLDLMWIRKERANRLGFMNRFITVKFLSAEEEKLYHESMEIDRTQCMKLEPIDKGTYVSVDGEAAAYSTTYVELHKGLANVIVI